MGLATHVEFLLNDAASVNLRAIKLFEFQVAIFYPRLFPRMLSTASDVRGATKKLRSARVLVAVRLLEAIEREMQVAQGDDQPISLGRLAKHEHYRAIFDDVIAPNGGWMRIRHSLSVRAFHEQIQRRAREAAMAAKIIDFSYRFAIQDPNSPRRAGVTSARYVVRTASCYGEHCSEGTAKNRWRKFGPTAIFLYLLLIHKFSLMPPRLSSQTFLGQLLSQASDTQALCTFFRAYEQVRKVLAPAQYKFEELALEWSCNAPSFDVPKLPQDALDALAKARAADRSEHPG